jgi:hypothetical protein
MAMQVAAAISSDVYRGRGDSGFFLAKADDARECGALPAQHNAPKERSCLEHDAT